MGISNTHIFVDSLVFFLLKVGCKLTNPKTLLVNLLLDIFRWV